MSAAKLLLTSALISLLTVPAFAQGTQQNANGRQQSNTSQNYVRSSRSPVATQPSNNPFQNPIGQGVPPAASANPALNSNRTFAPR
ncbi:hypothetical protein E4K65_41525 [Bradyrhizobium niftali]|uniref:Lipoprotein n=1 Tax=Bradyrhizobium niftali TaxID=2560055 RepID=A0A4Y9L829_9BRAD|nr:hypothetical protein E4K65_41525 [Bradyrhizobium niftali]